MHPVYTKIGQVAVWDNVDSHDISLSEDLNPGDYIFIVGLHNNRYAGAGSSLTHVTLADNFTNRLLSHYEVGLSGIDDISPRSSSDYIPVTAFVDHLTTPLTLITAHPVDQFGAPLDRKTSKSFLVYKVTGFSASLFTSGDVNGVLNSETGHSDSAAAIAGISGGGQLPESVLPLESGADGDYFGFHSGDGGSTAPGGRMSGTQITGPPFSGRGGMTVFWVTWCGPETEHIDGPTPFSSPHQPTPDWTTQGWTKEELATNEGIRWTDYEESISGLPTNFTGMLVDAHVLVAFKPTEDSEVDSGGPIKVSSPIQDFVTRYYGPGVNTTSIYWLAQLHIALPSSSGEIDSAMNHSKTIKWVFEVDDGNLVLVPWLVSSSGVFEAGSDNSLDVAGSCPCIRPTGNDWMALSYVSDGTFKTSRWTGSKEIDVQDVSTGTLGDFVLDKDGRGVWTVVIGDDWKVVVGVLQSDGKTWTLSSPQSMNLTDADPQIKGAIEQLPDRSFAFTHKVSGGGTRIARCVKLGNDGTGVWN